jgi:CheY-like chemotaxis protein
VTEPAAAHSILVVDDEPDSLETLRLLLLEEGFEVRVAANAAQALILIDERPPELLILDVMMPAMTGLDLCRHLRTEPRTQHIPCIAYTGYPMTAQAHSDLYDRVFLKPADFSELLKSIRELLPH